MERDEVGVVEEGREAEWGREGVIAVLLDHEFPKESYDWQSHAAGLCVHTSHCTAADTHSLRHTHPPMYAFKHTHAQSRCEFISMSICLCMCMLKKSLTLMREN